MEFDKSKVYTVFNCDEVKIGSKGYFANSRKDLIVRVEIENDGYYNTLKDVNLASDLAFITNCYPYHYFYLVEEPKEKTKRPCTREELMEMLKKQGLPMLKCNLNGINCMVGKMSDTHCTVYDCGGYNYSELCSVFTLLDGTELWVEE